MKKIYLFLLITVLLCVLAGCEDDSSHTVKIAVMGNEAQFYPGYKEGIERAERDLNREYADLGYNVECEFYGDDGNYEEASARIDTIAADESLTAVIGSMDMDTSKTAAYVFDSTGKLFVMPYFLYDDVYEDNNYSMVFSLCDSAENVGETLRLAGEKTTAKRWAVCASDASEFAQAEMTGFLQCETDSSMKVVDCVNMSSLETNFDEIYKRWETLGVEGVIMFPEVGKGFDVLKKLKQRNPNLICGGDTAFDNSTLLMSDKELLRAMTGFIIVTEVVIDGITEEEADRFKDMKDEYMKNTGKEIDLWYIQGYNAVRIIADTAIKNDTVDPVKIAEILHKDGYDGFVRDFSFDEKGAQNKQVYKYNIFNAEGIVEEFEIKK